MTYVLIILLLGPPPPQGVVFLFDTKKECEDAKERFCTDATRFKCSKCEGVFYGPV